MVYLNGTFEECRFRECNLGNLICDAMLSNRCTWVHAIRRVEGEDFAVRRYSTYVCGLHFEESDMHVHVESGRKYLTAQAVPSRFSWNNWGKTKKQETATSKRRGDVGFGEEMGGVAELSDAAIVTTGHDYDCHPPPGALDEALERIRELEKMVSRLTLSGPLLERWCISDEDFRYFTRFPSKRTFNVFWDSIQPSASQIVYWSKARRVGIDNMEREGIHPSPTRKLHLIDEFLMYCLRVATGLLERVLAEVFGVSTSTVSRVIITWSNYLYLILGSVPLWMTQEQVRKTMPLKFQQYSPKLRVIIDCTEFRCESPEAITLHSETFSMYKSHTTFKALIGVAPCGAITFVSKLFTGSISDQELTKESGILALLEPGDEVMADKGFFIEKSLQEVGAKLIIPPFRHKSQFSREETERTQAIARLRILVERAIRKVKEYHIWDSPIPLTLAGTVNQIWSNCCVMVNYQGPLDLDGEVQYWAE
ncbi:uncharacterized protein LOC118232112 [Anguilla anguilla]|uniref:uncharacterized protein LOC118232112 n=1 Tax=Anguilla anguilla TaxID=7936 RepID=UPI0015AA4032|nr:uncharacterized protein LOC118232112 [Anguilla anguilla]XP_035282647.1 uncharacterized protein LOC118232112 [Anguilla anguilla]XP_035282652.1 uncharacterized protein LOC118232112 [Anguilla anguilla]